MQNEQPTSLLNIERVLDRIARAFENRAATVDANGWSVYDYGSHRVYRKRHTFSVVLGGASTIALSSSNLPIGMSSIGTHFLQYSYTAQGNAYGLSMVYEGQAGTGSIIFTGRSTDGVGRTYTGWVDIELTSPI